MRLESDTCFDVTSAAPAAAFVLAVSSAGLSSLGRQGGAAVGGGRSAERELRQVRAQPRLHLRPQPDPPQMLPRERGLGSTRGDTE